jgi:hypothetical protein
MADLVGKSTSVRWGNVGRLTAAVDDFQPTCNPLLSHNSQEFQEFVDVCMILKCEETIFVLFSEQITFLGGNKNTHVPSLMPINILNLMYSPLQFCFHYRIINVQHIMKDCCSV